MGPITLTGIEGGGGGPSRVGVELTRLCNCGCDMRDGVEKSGYLYFSNGQKFLTIHLNEEQYQTVLAALKNNEFETADGGQAVTFNRLED